MSCVMVCFFLFFWIFKSGRTGTLHILTLCLYCLQSEYFVDARLILSIVMDFESHMHLFFAFLWPSRLVLHKWWFWLCMLCIRPIFFTWNYVYNMLVCSHISILFIIFVQIYFWSLFYIIYGKNSMFSRYASDIPLKTTTFLISQFYKKRLSPNNSLGKFYLLHE
jgi:hypothetical protein